jgi:transcriptional regulator with XRE-family HTH domain
MTVRNGRLDRRTTKPSKISDLHKRVVQNIREIRLEMGFTATKMAELMKMAQPTYTAIETARCDIQLKTLEKIAKLLQQPVAVLFTREPRWNG